LKNQSDFNAHVLKESLQVLMLDDSPHVALMRTALLSANHFSEVKKFVLMELIPTLVHRRVWVIAPKVWEGVLVGADSLTTGNVSSKWIEPTLRALLAVPGVTLKALLKVNKNLKRTLAKYLQSVPVDERDDILATPPAPITITTITATESAITGTETSAIATIELDKLVADPVAVAVPVVDAEKKKIAKELLSLNCEASSVSK
jgi:hypothetical protein